jgi:segregation and condensation protein A
MPPTDDESAARHRRPLGRGPGAAPTQPPEPEDQAPAPAPVPPAAQPYAGQGEAGAASAPPQDHETPGEPPGSSRAPEDGEEPPRGPAAPPEAPHPPHDAPPHPDARPDAVDGAGTGADEAARDDGRFTVRLVNFEGPFDLLLQLISKHKLDVTEVALSKVTDEFMAHIRAMGKDWDLDQTTEFLVVAATLLDLKAARLLPAAEVEDEADLALLEARDLLFARLLQYRAYKQVAALFSERLDEEARRYPRTVSLEPGLADLLPDVVIRIGPEGFARLAVKAMQPKPEPQVYVDHIHAPLVSVQDQARVVVSVLRDRGSATFEELTADTDDTLTVVARFLALLELYRARAVALDQEDPLGALLVRWTGEDGEADVAAVVGEFDQDQGQDEPAGPAERGDGVPAAKEDVT